MKLCAVNSLTAASHILLINLKWGRVYALQFSVSFFTCGKRKMIGGGDGKGEKTQRPLQEEVKLFFKYFAVLIPLFKRLPGMHTRRMKLVI